MRITHCDGPQCEQAIMDSTGDEVEPLEAWLHLDAWNEEDCGDFCSWQCLANVAMSHALD